MFPLSVYDFEQVRELILTLNDLVPEDFMTEATQREVSEAVSMMDMAASALAGVDAQPVRAEMELDDEIVAPLDREDEEVVVDQKIDETFDTPFYC